MGHKKIKSEHQGAAYEISHLCASGTFSGVTMMQMKRQQTLVFFGEIVVHRTVRSLQKISLDVIHAA